MKKCPRVAIVGAGFGGLQAAQSLANRQVEVILLDRHNYHTFVPLLYQVATAQLAPEQVVVPIRTHLRRLPNTRFLAEEVQQIDYEAKLVTTHNRTLGYDFLVLATGSQSQFLGVVGAKEWAFPLKTLNHAVRLRNHLLHCFERAEIESDYSKRQQLLTIAIVGGGATGVEMAGALVELIAKALQRDYPRLQRQEVTLVLLQSGDRLMAEFPKSLGDYTARKLRRLGVKVMLQSRVKQITADGIEFRDARESLSDEGIWLDCGTVIWAVGGSGAIPQSLPVPPTEKRQKIQVLPTLQLANYPEVFAIGDLASVVSRGKPLSGVAPEALQQGVYVARAIRQQLQGKTPKPFHYFNKGRLAIVGGYSGIGQIGIWKLTGFLPWFGWLAVHLVYFPDWRNRLLILLTWLHNYVLGDRAVRLIFSPPDLMRVKSNIPLELNQS